MTEKSNLFIYNSLLLTGSRLFVFSVIFIFVSSSLFAQLTTNILPGPAGLVNNLVGNGVKVSNITYTGDPTARGLFNGVNSNIGLNSGVILSTGKVSNATGPNNDPIGGSCMESECVKSTDFGRQGDADLEAIEGCVGCTYDAAILEFDFIPQSTPLTFNYVFASEECPCYVCSGFNDIFGFLITGPNPVVGQPAYNKQDIALIPGTQKYVSIGSVNDGTPGFNPITGTFYPPSGCVSLNYSMDFVNNGDGSTPLADPTVQYNGFTIPFAATIDVIPCQTYHIKLAIADVGDGKYDSAVLLQQGSLATPSASASTTYSKPNVSNSSAVEGCSDAFVCYNLPQPLSSDYVIPLQYSGTAPNNGTSYPLLPASVTIPAGQTQTCIQVSPIIQPGNTVNNVIISSQISSCGTENDTINIIPNTVLKASPNNPTVTICQGVSATISVNASGGITTQPYQYAWSNGAGNLSSIQVSPNSTTLFTVTVTDACGATAVTNINVILQTAPNINISPNTAICNGSSTTLAVTGAGAGSSYLWSNGGNSSSINVNPATFTKYFVSVEYATGCYIYDSVNVSVNPLPIINITNDTSICKGSDAKLIATSPSNVTWKWSDGATASSRNVTPSKTTAYTVVATDANNCTSSAIVNVTVNPNPVPVGNSEAICLGDSTVLTVAGAGIGGTYLWNNGSTTSSITVKPIVNTNYSVKLTNTFGCFDDTSFVVTVNPIPVPLLPADYSVCKSSSTSITASGAGVNGNYSWSNGVNTPTINVTPLVSTLYVVTVTTQFSCSATDSVKVNVNNNPIANAGADTAICNGATASLHGSVGPNFLWSTGATTGNIQVNPSVTTVYGLTVTNGNGCFGSASVTVTVNPIPTSGFTISPEPVCINQSAKITYTGQSSNTATFTWDVNGNNTYAGQGPFQVSWDTAGTKTITLTVIDKNCSSSLTVNTILVNALPVAKFVSVNDSGCQPLTVQFTDSSKFANAGSTYLWNFGDGQTSADENPSHIYTKAGIYSVTFTVTNASVGCSDTSVIINLINVYANPVAKFYVVPGSTVTELDPTVFVFSNSIGKIKTYNWTLSGNDSVYTDSSFTNTFKEAGTYKVTLFIVNSLGCSDTTSGFIFVKPYFTLYVPNAFMPSRCKESQDCWFMVKGNNISEFHIWIYDRWGAVSYTSKNINEGWDGKVNGTLAREGVYIYRIDYTDVNSHPHTIWGHVTLIR